jgi:hypothetical protein
MALFNTFGVNRWLKFEVLRKSDGGGGDGGGGSDSGQANNPPPAPPTPAPTNQYSSATYVDSKAVSLGKHIVLIPTKSLHR